MVGTKQRRLNEESLMTVKHLKEMFNILSEQGNSNQNDPKIPSECLRSKTQVTAHVCKDGWNAHLYKHFGSHLGFSENWE